MNNVLNNSTNDRYNPQNFDEIEQRHHEEVDKLNDSIGSLRRQIQEMLSQFKDIGMERYMEMMKNDEQ